MSRTIFTAKIPGLLFITVIAILSYGLMALPFFTHLGLSSLVIAIVIGIAIGNIWHHSVSFTPGVQFAAKRLLRTAIILYGFRISLQQIASVGPSAFFIDLLVVTCTLIVGYLLGRKFLKLDRDLSLLISVGAAICGAAAVLAVEDILKSESYKATVAVATVVIFGTLSMFIYPALQHANFLGLTSHQFGLFAGASIHEVAQVLVAGTNISIDTGKTAVIVKMMRVLLLVPILFLFSFVFNRQQVNKQHSKLNIPWFAVGFVFVILFNSLHILPVKWIELINQIDIILLTMAMAAIGVETKWKKIKNVGLKPLYLAIILFIWLFGSVLLMVKTF